jgi:hypothetical protein
MEEYQNPEWATPCGRFIEYMLQAIGFVNMTQRGAGVLVKLPRTIDSLMTSFDFNFFFPEEEKSTREEQINEMKWMARLAESEIEDDFPLLHSHTLLGAWGALEGMIEDLAILRIQYCPSILEEPKLAKVKIPLVDFQKMTDHERLRFLVTELQRDLGLDLKSGATKFEPLLALVGLGGSIDRRVRDALFECQNLRNLFAHRAGIADRRFVASCPHLHYSVGDAVKIGDEVFARNFFGLLTYGAIILNRCRTIERMKPFDSDFPMFEGVLTDYEKADDVTGQPK